MRFQLLDSGRPLSQDRWVRECKGESWGTRGQSTQGRSTQETEERKEDRDTNRGLLPDVPEPEPRLEDLEVVENLWIHEVQEAPELLQRILDRGAAEQEPVLGVEALELAYKTAVPVLDPLAFIDHKVLPLVPEATATAINRQVLVEPSAGGGARIMKD